MDMGWKGNQIRMGDLRGWGAHLLESQDMQL